MKPLGNEASASAINAKQFANDAPTQFYGWLELLPL
jgi:hypothetical protein